jgi:hypothetical protein
MTKQKRILSQMFDVKPVNRDGSLDLEKIKSLQKTVTIVKERMPLKSIGLKNTSDIRRKTVSDPINKHANNFQRSAPIKKVILPKKNEYLRKPNIIQLGKTVSDDLISISRVPLPHQTFTDADFHERTSSEHPVKKAVILEKVFEQKQSNDETTELFERKIKKARRKKSSEKRDQKRRTSLRLTDLFLYSPFTNNKFGYGLSFLAVLLLFSLAIPGISLIQRGLDTKSAIIISSGKALGQMAQAKDDMTNGQFEKAASSFDESYEILNRANEDVSGIGGRFSEILRFVPGVSRVATANYILAAGQSLALSGKNLANSAKSLNSLQNPINQTNSDSQPALTDIFLKLRDGAKNANDELKKAQDNLSKVNSSDLPEEVRSDFFNLKEKLPVIITSLEGFLDNSQIILDILGYNGPRKFLFLFQNNQEIRATGGFIGSYGILDISNGRIKKLFVDDIYNPDGQLQAKIIPPDPIQKMSAAWTMHDANWFPDFPASAEKISWFYEKTGGPTVDGVIAVTPNLIQNLLEVTGPIEMPEYDTTVDKENFIEKTQYEVEVDYDKELNRPKKFIADLTPKIFDKVFSTRDMASMIKVLNIFNTSLKEKHLLVYSKNYNLQKLISGQGWSGEMKNASKDYLSVINTNINGYKTDGVIDEAINHESEIQEDGSIVDIVTITRKHNGGNEKYDWWNKVNSDYTRVYVPEGSKLLEASGQTREFISPPLDYQSLGFKKDPQVKSQEDETNIDEESGTRVYTENQKTVFANWIYVSPGETVTLKYKYVLPFKLSFDYLHHPADSFSVLYQKQSGSVGSKLNSEIKLPQNYRIIWRWPDNLENNSGELKMETLLNVDRYWGIAVEKQ